MVDEEVAAVGATDGAADPGQRHAGALEGGGGQGGRGAAICLVDHRVTCSTSVNSQAVFSGNTGNISVKK